MKVIPPARTRLDRLALPLGLVGIAAVAAHNWRLWRRDKAFLAERAEPEPLPPLSEWPELPLVSVLVAAWNETVHIDHHIESFLTLRYPHKELVLCAGGEDGTYERACRYAEPAVKVLLQEPGEGKQRALRRCLPNSNGRIIYLTDADCELSDDAFNLVMYPLIHNGASVVSGCSRPIDNQLDKPLVLYQWLNDANWSLRLPEIVDGILGRNAAMRRYVLESIGGFDDEVRTGTDYYMSHRLAQSGHEITCAPQSYMATEYPATGHNYVRMWRRWNKNLLLHGIHFKAWRDVRNVLVASGLYAGMVTLSMLAPFIGRIALVTPGLLFSIALGNRARRIAAGALFSGTPLKKSVLMLLPIITAMDMLAVCLAVVDSILSRRRAKW